jgi:competence CoiA-like predicted nuclease
LRERRIYGQDDTSKNVSGHLPSWIMGKNVNKEEALEQLQKAVKTLLTFPLASTRKFHKFYLKGRGFCEFTTKKYI